MPTAPSLPRWALFPFLVLAVWVPDSAWAYCRQTTCDREDCPIDRQGCISAGDELYYDVPCLSFGFDAGSAEPLGISDDEMLELIAQAFQSWKDVECPGGGQPSFEVQAVGVVDARGIFFCEEEETNVSVWTLDQTWNYEASSLGYTTSTFVVDDGEIYDADVELNLRRIASIVPPNGDVAGAVLSVATHEAGHFLGLAHSDDFGAVMAATYADLAPRALTDDDVAGICALYPPSGGNLSCSEPGVSEAGYDQEACAAATGSESESDGSCSVARGAHGNGGGYAALVAGAAFCALRRRGKRHG